MRKRSGNLLIIAARCPSGFVPWPRFGELARPFACGLLLYAVAFGFHLFGATNVVSRGVIFAALGVALFLVPAGLMERDLTLMLRDRLFAQRTGDTR